jgi:hypothetical protein
LPCYVLKKVRWTYYNDCNDCEEAPAKLYDVFCIC